MPHLAPAGPPLSAHRRPMPNNAPFDAASAAIKWLVERGHGSSLLKSSPSSLSVENASSQPRSSASRGAASAHTPLTDFIRTSAGFSVPLAQRIFKCPSATILWIQRYRVWMDLIFPRPLRLTCPRNAELSERTSIYMSRFQCCNRLCTPNPTAPLLTKPQCSLSPNL